jgi:hypothetical protein
MLHLADHLTPGNALQRQSLERKRKTGQNAQNDLRNSPEPFSILTRFPFPGVDHFLAITTGTAQKHCLAELANKQNRENTRGRKHETPAVRPTLNNVEMPHLSRFRRFAFS